MDLLQEIKDRKSYRSFSDLLISEKEIELIFEAARLAPSSSNAQAWQYYFSVRGTEGFDKLNNCLTLSNQVWAKNAAILVLCTAAKNYENGKAYKHAWHDVGLANAQMLLQATHIGIIGHPMGGYHADKAEEAVNLPASHETVCMIAFGYLGDGSNLNVELQQRENLPRKRKPMGEVVIKL